MKAIFLARVSDKKQDSNEAQMTRVLEYAKYKNLEVWKTYELEESSTQGNRLKFQEVITVITKSTEIIALVVDTIDRLQRSFKDSVYLEDLRKAGKLEIHFYRENLIIKKDSNSSELLRWDIGVMFARGYVLQLSDNVKRKYEQMRRNGEWTGKPPFGYESVYNEDLKRTNIIPSPKTAHFVRKMFELYATGNYSVVTIRDTLTKEGLHSGTGTIMTPSMVYHILNNPFYYGEMRTMGKVYNHKYEPLITRALFDQSQKVQKSWKKKPFAYASKPFILRGLVRCHKCGCSLSPELKKGKYVYYSCTNARKDICNSKVYVKEETLLEPVYEVFDTFEKIPQKKINWLVDELKKSTEAKNLYHSTSINSLQSEYNETQTRINRMMDLLIDGSITKDDYDKRLQQYKDKQYDLNIQLEEHTKADESYYITVATMFSLAKHSRELFESSEVPEKRAILNYILQNYTVNEKTPCITMRSPFVEMLSMATQPIGRGVWFEVGTFLASNIGNIT
jgi:DNA invertase Pin-like site-specific DNA recombinase